MDTNLKTSIWQQFGASIDYLAGNISACPDSLWRASLWPTLDIEPEFSQFWYVAYHTLFWLDCYLTGAVEDFLPPPPFTLGEEDARGLLPERVYSKAELLAYLTHCRSQCRATIDALTDEKAQQHCKFGWGELSFLELLIYNLRHVHGHASQLNMLLGQNGVPAPGYQTRIKHDP